MEPDAGFVRKTHCRCEDCDIREDLHASGSPLPKRRHQIARCATCGGKGELPLDRKAGLDPYRSKAPPGRAQFYEAKRAKRAYAERHRFRAKTFDFDVIELLMQMPPWGSNYGWERIAGSRIEFSTLTAQALQSGLRIDPEPQRPSKRLRPIATVRHGTRAAYVHDRCRCADCRAANASYHSILRRAA